MEKLIEIKFREEILVSSKVISFELPDYIYVPIGAESNILVHKDDYVSIGTSVIESKGAFFTSPISGRVNAIKEVNTVNGLKSSIEIINDFKEKKIIESVSKRNLKKVKNEEINNILINNFGLNLTNTKNLILNCIDDEPLVSTQNFYLFLYYEGFLELLDKIAQIYELERIIICLKSSSSENINKLINHIGMYPNISLNILPNLYLLGKDKFLLRHLGLKEDNSKIIKASTFYNIYNLIKRNRCISDKLITITGNGVKNPSIIRVKIGSLIKECLDNLIDIKEDVVYFANNIMEQEELDIKNFIVTSDLTSILIMKKEEVKESSKCLNCGACLDICPVNLNPILLKNRKYHELVKDKCLNCGLCSYICPVYINFKKDIKGEYYDTL